MNMNWSTWNAATKASWSIQHLLLWLIWWENLWEKCSHHLTHHCWCNRALAEIVDISVVPSHSKGAGISDICKNQVPEFLLRGLLWSGTGLISILSPKGSIMSWHPRLHTEATSARGSVGRVLQYKVCWVAGFVLSKKSRGELCSLGQSLVADRKAQNWTMRKILPKWIFRLLARESSMKIWQISHFLGTTNFTWLGVGVSMRLALFGFFYPILPFIQRCKGSTFDRYWVWHSVGKHAADEEPRLETKR